MTALLESSPEQRKNTFSVQNLYRAEDVYARLTRDHRSSEIFLDNNWSEIIEPDVDPFNEIRILLSGLVFRGALKGLNVSDIQEKEASLDLPEGSIMEAIKEKYDRFQKVNWMGALLMLPDDSLNFTLFDDGKRAKFQETLKLRGLDFDWVTNDHTLSGREKAHLETVTHEPRGLVLEYDVSDEGEPGFIISYPWTYRYDTEGLDQKFLNSPELFSQYYKTFIEATDKTIRATYEFVGEQLPPEMLVLKPDPKEVTKDVRPDISCEFCQGRYNLKFDACTHCGAPAPISESTL